eukprot:scaffold1827_cov421-Prasinococcus_capsulatus_cf.AAC.35
MAPHTRCGLHPLPGRHRMSTAPRHWAPWTLQAAGDTPTGVVPSGRNGPDLNPFRSARRFQSGILSLVDIIG